VSNGVGLTSVVTGTATLDAAIQHMEDPGIDVLTSGPLPPNPPDVLGAQGTMALIAELAARYDVVILDTPPIVGLSDVPVIAEQVDGILMVVNATQTGRGQFVAALHILAGVAAPLLGFVYNKAYDPRRRGSYYSSYGSTPDDRASG
jgi:receptor protein-tyrosine kinase